MTVLDFVKEHPDFQISELAKYGCYYMSDLYAGLIYGDINESLTVKRSLAMRIFCVDDQCRAMQQRNYVLRLLNRHKKLMHTPEHCAYYNMLKSLCNGGTGITLFYIERAKDWWYDYFIQLATYGLQTKAHEGCLGAATAELVCARNKDTEAEAQLEMLREIGNIFGGDV